MLNKTTLQGRLTKMPELSTTNSGISVCNFTVAWSEKQGETEKQLFLYCTAWRNTAEFIAKYFDKGQEIIVEGKLTQEKYESNGEQKNSTKLNVESVHFCGKKSDNTATEPGKPRTAELEKIDTDMLPF